MATILIRLLLFILPFALFFFVMHILKKRIKEGDKDEPELERKIANASLVAIVLLFAGMVYIFITGETNNDKIYVPPKEVGGEIIPGHFKDE